MGCIMGRSPLLGSVSEQSVSLKRMQHMQTAPGDGLTGSTACFQETYMGMDAPSICNTVLLCLCWMNTHLSCVYPWPTILRPHQHDSGAASSVHLPELSKQSQSRNKIYQRHARGELCVS